MADVARCWPVLRYISIDYRSIASNFRKYFFCSSVISEKIGTSFSVTGSPLYSGDGICMLAATLWNPWPTVTAAPMSGGQSAFFPAERGRFR